MLAGAALPEYTAPGPGHGHAGGMIRWTSPILGKLQAGLAPIGDQLVDDFVGLGG